MSANAAPCLRNIATLCFHVVICSRNEGNDLLSCVTCSRIEGNDLPYTLHTGHSLHTETPAGLVA